MEPEEVMLEMVEESGFVNVLTGCGLIPAVQLPISSVLLDQPIEVLGLSTRAYNGLGRLGVLTVGGVVERLRKKDSLLAEKHLGKVSVGEIKLKLTELVYNDLSDKEKLDFWRYFLQKSERVSQGEADAVPA